MIWFYFIADNYRYITLAIMKYHITLARNDVIGKLAGSRSLCSLDDFQEPYTAIIVKNWLLGSDDSTFFEIYFFPRVLKKRDFGNF